jgi:casein kinase 1
MRIANYEYDEKIGQGAFGIVYKGRNIRTGEQVVIKTEPQYVEFSSLKHESNILNILYSKYCRNIPPTYWYGIIPELNNRVLVMPYYESSLETFVPTTKKMVCNIIHSAISILSHIHNKYVVHRDIKPANFMIHNDELVLIDFGLATFYVDSNEKHIPYAKREHVVGTPKYISWNVHCGDEYSRRDDLMSVLYIGLFFIYGKELWETDLCLNIQNKEDKTSIHSPKNIWFKSQKTLANIMNMASSWKELAEFAENIYSLSFQERPSYKQYIELFTKTI